MVIGARAHVLVTGAAGFIGTELAEILTARGQQGLQEVLGALHD